MIRAKNYETVSTFVKVMARILWPPFSRTRCIYIVPSSQSLYRQKQGVLVVTYNIESKHHGPVAQCTFITYHSTYWL